jgi:hypothetical protein
VGLINRVVPRAELDAAVDVLCEELLAKLPEVVRATKTQLDFWRDLSWSLTIRHAREWLTLHAASDEVREGSTASRRNGRPITRAFARLAPPASGHSAGPAAPHATVDGLRCPFCGRGPLASDAVFCGYCGKPLLGA